MRLIETCGVNAENVGAALRGCPAMNFSLAAFRGKQVSHAGLPLRSQPRLRKIRTILATMLIATIVVQTTGCTGCERLEETNYRVGLGGGVMSDSTALLSRCGTNYYFTEGFITGGGDRDEDIGCSLLLVDIRFEKIYWEKKVHNDDVILNAVLDSILFFTDRWNYYYYDHRKTNKIATHRLDDGVLKPKKIDLTSEDWKSYMDIRVRPWQHGLILVIHGGSEYALIDTIARTMELWQPIGEFEWLNECTDAKWSPAGVLCLRRIPDTLGFVLLRNGVDTLAVRYMHELPVRHRGVIFAGNSIISWGWIYLMSEQGQVSKTPLDILLCDRNGFFFCDFHGNEIHYNKKIVY